MLALCPRARSPKWPSPFTGRLSGLGFAFHSQARQCIRPNRVQHVIAYGLGVRLRLLSPPSLDDAVTFSYGPPVLGPKRTFTSLCRCAFRRTNDGVPPLTE